MPIPSYYYKSSGMPIGSRSVTFKRPATATAPAGPGGSGDTTLGTYLLETSSPKGSSKTIGRIGIAGQDLDFALVQQRNTMSGAAQLSTAITPTLERGDYFEDSFDIDPSGTATSNERYVINDRENVEQAGEARKQNISLMLDWNNSARWA